MILLYKTGKRVIARKRKPKHISMATNTHVYGNESTGSKRGILEESILQRNSGKYVFYAARTEST
jgi:hypothetical protein